MGRTISFTEVEQAQWVVIDEHVYDISHQWGDVHPGGSYVLEKWKGRDATHEFHTLHSAETRESVSAGDNLFLPPHIGRLAPVSADHEVELDKMEALVRVGIPIAKIFQMGNGSPSILRSLCRTRHRSTDALAEARQITHGVACMAAVSPSTGKDTHRAAYLSILEEYYGASDVRQWMAEASLPNATPQWQQDYAEWLKEAKTRAQQLPDEEKRRNLQREQEKIEKDGGSGIIEFWKQGEHENEDSIDLWRKFRTASLGHRDTDEEHDEILDAFDALGEHPTEERLHHLRDALKRHFQHEEELMLKVGIPMDHFIVHHAQHHNFLSWAYSISCPGKLDDVQEFARGCKQRFKNHSEYTDARFMRFIVDERYAQRIRSSTNGLQ